MRSLTIILTCVSLGAACGGGAPRIPESPPSTLAVVADEADEPEEQAEAEGGADATPGAADLRRGPCGIPLSVSSEALMLPAGVRRLQQALVEAGLLALPYDGGELDPPTLDALMALQRREGLPPVGLPTYASVRALGLELHAVFQSGDPNCVEGS